MEAHRRSAPGTQRPRSHLKRGSRSGPSLRVRGRILCLLALLAAACGPADRAAGTRRQLPGTPVSVDTTARLRLGVAEGDTALEFQQVVHPFLLPDGRVAVPVAGSGTIRVFSPEGRLLESLGRPGEGPGEFRLLVTAWARGDTVEAFDAVLGRITRFPPDGDPEIVKLALAPSAQAAVPGVLPDGWVLIGVESAGIGRRDTVAVHRYRLDGSDAGVIARVAGIRRVRTPTRVGPDPLSPRMAVAVGGGRVYVAQTLSPVIRVLAPDGRQERELGWSPGARPAPREAFNDVVKAASGKAGAAGAEAARRRIRAFPVADRVPAFWGYLVDARGFVWIEPFDPARRSVGFPHPVATAGAVTWTILPPDGARTENISLPGSFEPTWIGDHAMVGVRRDDLGVEYVEVHYLRRH